VSGEVRAGGGVAAGSVSGGGSSKLTRERQGASAKSRARSRQGAVD